MNKHLDTLLDHAKKFDEDYIKTDKIDLYCANETLIKDYIIAKSVITSNLKTTIIIDPINLSSIQAEFKDILGKTGLDKKVHKYPRNSSIQIKDDVIVFKNDSAIWFSGYEKPSEHIKNIVMKVMYIANSALDSLHALGNGKYFEEMIDDDTTRVIYNYD